MTNRSFRWLVPALVASAVLAVRVTAQDAPKPTVKIPEPGVPQVMTLEGRYVRAAYNNEGYVILGYRVTNQNVGQPWLLLEVGITVRKGVSAEQLTRDAISLETPNGKTIPLPSNKEFQAANLTGLQKQADMMRDSINYFPPDATRAARLGFFADLTDRTMGFDKVELTPDRAVLGRLYFPIPGGIAYGQHWLNVKFANSLVRVPFRVLTKDEAKFLDKNFKDIEKQVQDAFAPKPR